MKNFIFKSQQDFHKILFNKLEMVLAELRHQRHEHKVLLSLINELVTNKALQKQVDEYFEEDAEHIPEEKLDGE